jgi:hypothetical protein
MGPSIVSSGIWIGDGAGLGDGVGGTLGGTVGGDVRFGEAVGDGVELGEAAGEGTADGWTALHAARRIAIATAIGSRHPRPALRPSKSCRWVGLSTGSDLNEIADDNGDPLPSRSVPSKGTLKVGGHGSAPAMRSNSSACSRRNPCAWARLISTNWNSSPGPSWPMMGRSALITIAMAG